MLYTYASIAFSSSNPSKPTSALIPHPPKKKTQKQAKQIGTEPVFSYSFESVVPRFKILKRQEKY